MSSEPKFSDASKLPSQYPCSRRLCASSGRGAHAPQSGAPDLTSRPEWLTAHSHVLGARNRFIIQLPEVDPARRPLSSQSKSEASGANNSFSSWAKE
jgi:hypothetical protein